MRLNLPSFLAAAVLVAIGGCEAARDATPLAPGGFLAAKGPSAGVELRVRDECEPASFNAAVGPDTCVGDGNVTFERFIAELQKEQDVGSWRFQPLDTQLDRGTVLRIHNRGGEVHTVTLVAEFGGGFVDELNVLSGTPTLAPECAFETPEGLRPQPPGPTNVFVGPDGEAGFPALPRGTHHLQCCVHPWMRSTIVIR